MYFIVQLCALLLAVAIGAVAFSVGPVIVFVRVQGAEFLLNDAVLIPALIAAFALVILTIYASFRVHRFNRPLILSAAGGLAVLLGLWLSGPLAAVGYLFTFWAIFEDYNVLTQLKEGK
ncbi:MAG: hypothetical protein OEW08_05925 [Gammaproteobacteria bacterium]|nr:hypothetical protein [Gammaproteobacteria bacterium]